MQFFVKIILLLNLLFLTGCATETLNTLNFKFEDGKEMVLPNRPLRSMSLSHETTKPDGTKESYSASTDTIDISGIIPKELSL